MTEPSEQTRRRHTYPRPGEVIAVPLDDGFHAVGVVLALGRPVMATAFLDFAVASPSDLEFGWIAPERVVTVDKHGPLGFQEEWKILGALPGFDPDDWPPLEFYEECSDSIVVYSRKVRPVQRRPGHGNGDARPAEGTSGHIYLQNVLSRVLGHST